MKLPDFSLFLAVIIPAVEVIEIDFIAISPLQKQVIAFPKKDIGLVEEVEEGFRPLLSSDRILPRAMALVEDILLDRLGKGKASQGGEVEQSSLEIRIAVDETDRPPHPDDGGAIDVLRDLPLRKIAQEGRVEVAADGLKDKGVLAQDLLGMLEEIFHVGFLGNRDIDLALEGAVLVMKLSRQLPVLVEPGLRIDIGMAFSVEQIVGKLPKDKGAEARELPRLVDVIAAFQKQTKELPSVAVVKQAPVATKGDHEMAREGIEEKRIGALRPKGETRLGTKCECKNLNTIQNIRAAVDYEIERQSAILLSGGQVDQETRRYDENAKKTVLMRRKTDAIDYKYFREPNIVPIDLDEGFIYDCIHSMNKLPAQYRKELSGRGLDAYQIEELLKDREFVLYFEDCLDLGVKNPTTLWNLLMVEILGYLNKNGLSLKDIRPTKEQVVSLSDLLSTGAINSRQGKDVLSEMLTDGKDPLTIVKEKGMEQISDSASVEKVVEEVLAQNQQSVSDWQKGKDRALGYLVGQAMKKSQGKVNPALAKEKILAKIGPCGSKK